MGSHTLSKSGLYIALAAVAVIFVMTAVASAQPSPTNVIYVGENETYQSIQDAIDDAADGDTIVVMSDYDPSNDASGITIDKSITLQGEVPSVVVEPSDPANAVTIGEDTIYYQIRISASGVTIKDLTIKFHMSSSGDTVALVIDSGLSDIELNNVKIETAASDQYPIAFIVPLSPATITDVTLQANLEPLSGEEARNGPSPLSPAPPGVTAVWVPSTVSGVTFSGFTISGTWDYGFYIEGSNNVFIGNSVTLTDSVTQTWAAAFYVLGASNTIGTSGSPNNIVLDTTSAVKATLSMVGIDVEASDNTVVQYNNIQLIWSGSSAYLLGILVWNSCGVSISSNTVFSTTLAYSSGIQ
ncbi:MAG: right-handed parallel beta-helix repeat-containing protein, partial [Thermoplasmata archaeon]|nr:right-handed parallel beta-helix repeat-containing protein [Thermoplasmata archaeon]